MKCLHEVGAARLACSRCLGAASEKNSESLQCQVTLEGLSAQGVSNLGLRVKGLGI